MAQNILVKNRDLGGRKVAVNARTVAITPDVYAVQEDSTAEVLSNAAIPYTTFAQPRPKSGRIQILDISDGVTSNPGMIVKVGINGKIYERQVGVHYVPVDGEIEVLTAKGIQFEYGRPSRGMTLLLDMLNSTALDSRITFTRSAGTATRINASGLMETVAADTPRFDYDPETLAPLGLLMEPAATNLITKSNIFDHANWTKSNITSATPAAGISPTGANDAYKLIPNATAGAHSIYAAWSATVQAYDGSIYVKAAEYGVIALGLMNNGANKGDAFNARTGAAIPSGSMSNSPFSGSAGLKLKKAGNGWFRIDVTGTPNGAGNWYLYVYVIPNGTDYNSAGDTTSGILISRAQVEAGAVPTSYIDTDASAVARNVDAASMTGSNFSTWFNSLEGTFFVECDAIGTTSAARGVIQASDATSNNRISIFAQTNWKAQIVNGGATQLDLAGTAMVDQAVTRIGVGYKADDSLFAQDGALQNDTSVTLPTVSRLDIGGGAGLNAWRGHIRSVTYYSTRLPDMQEKLATAA